MRVRVKLYASLRKYAPDGSSGSAFEVELPEGATLEELVRGLNIPPDEARIAFINGLICELDHPLKSGDEVGLFPPIAGGLMTDISIDVWLYGELAHYGRQARQPGYANLNLNLPAGSTIRDLLDHLNIPDEARGITFINSQLSAMPGLQPDLDHVLQNGDRVAFFHTRAMWPFQYRTGIPMTAELTAAMKARADQGVRHSYQR